MPAIGRTYIPSLWSLPPISLPSHPSRLMQSLFEFPESHSKFPLAICFTYGNVSFHFPLSIHLTLSSPPLFPQVCSLMSVSPLLPWKCILQCRLSGLCVRAVAYGVHLSPSDPLHSEWQALSSPPSPRDWRSCAPGGWVTCCGVSATAPPPVRLSAGA